MKSPLITMTAITGRPTSTEIYNYMKGLKDNGIEQVMLYPRSGCELDYLSDEWFEKISEFIDCAERLDINIWLYDEFNWPSGDANGRVTAIKEFRLKSITVKGENIGQIGEHSKHNASLFGQKFFPDLLSEKAVEYFIACTHEKYFKKFGKYFGNVIKGFFTDEPSIGYCCSETAIPYYYGMEADYKDTYGNDFYSDMQNSYHTFCQNAMELVGEQFLKCFINKIRNWCTEHNILFTGHLMWDNAPFSSTKYNGNFLKNLSAFSLPGIDEISTPFNEHILTNGSLYSLFGGAEYASGEHGAMAELFALGPCDMSYATKRCMLFMSSCFKINHYFLAISPLDMRGNTKIRDYFNCFSTDQPDFSGTVLLSKDAQLAAEYAKKDFIPDVYINYPADICRAHVTDQFDITPFLQIINRLSASQIQWKYISDGDAYDNRIPVLAFNDKMEYILNGIVTSDANIICNILQKELLVTDADGKLPTGLFVRKFDDNTVIVLNLYGKSALYKINGKDIELDIHSVYFGSIEPQGTLTLKREKLYAPFMNRYCNHNMIRAMLISPRFSSKLSVLSDQQINFAVRKDTCASLSGEKIECTSTNHLLPAGLKNLYNVSQTVTLKKGTYILTGDNDFKYLPSIFVIGDFSAQFSPDDGSVTLVNRKQEYSCGEYFNDFGKVEYTCDITVPDNAKAIEIKGTTLYTRVYANNTLLGEKIYAPYMFDIAEHLQNKHITLKITQYSSIAPIFSDLYYFEKQCPNTQWKHAPKPDNVKFGFSEINWIV